jgi:hypothetical protein
MHSNARFHQSNQDIFKNPDNLVNKEVFKKLLKIGEMKCVEFLGEEIKNDEAKFKTCKRNIMCAIECVARSKANTQIGDLRDNLGICKDIIVLAKDNIDEVIHNFPHKKLDDYLREVNFSTRNIY